MSISGGKTGGDAAEMSIDSPIEIKVAKPARMEELLCATVDRDASDLHLTAGMPPVFRMRGELTVMNCDAYGPEEIETLVIRDP